MSGDRAVPRSLTEVWWPQVQSSVCSAGLRLLPLPGGPSISGGPWTRLADAALWVSWAGLQPSSRLQLRLRGNSPFRPPWTRRLPWGQSLLKPLSPALHEQAPGEATSFPLRVKWLFQSYSLAWLQTVAGHLPSSRTRKTALCCESTEGPLDAEEGYDGQGPRGLLGGWSASAWGV